MKRDTVIVHVASGSPFRAPFRPGVARRSQRHVPTILVIDRDPAVRQALVRALQAPRCRIQCCASPEEGLLLLSKDVPDLLIVDLAAGGVSGWDVLFHEALERPTLPIIAIGRLAAGQTCGADRLARAYFQKPLDPDRLAEAVRRCLQVNAVIRIA